MSRFLFVVAPIAERARPTIVAGRELAARGHEVAWVVDGDGDRDGFDALCAAAASRRLGSLCSPAGQLQLWDDFVLPVARAMVPTVRAAISQHRPDVVVADHLALAGAAVAQVHGIPWVTSVATSAGLVDPLEDLPAVRQRVRRRVHRFLREVGLDDITAARFDVRASPHLVLAYTTAALVGHVDRPGSRHVLVGPCVASASVPGELRGEWDEWSRIDPDRPLVGVSLATPARGPQGPPLPGRRRRGGAPRRPGDPRRPGPPAGRPARQRADRAGRRPVRPDPPRRRRRVRRRARHGLHGAPPRDPARRRPPGGGAADRRPPGRPGRRRRARPGPPARPPADSSERSPPSSPTRASSAAPTASAPPSPPPAPPPQPTTSSNSSPPPTPPTPPRPPARTTPRPPGRSELAPSLVTSHRPS
jgi:hypothetical protein